MDNKKIIIIGIILLIIIAGVIFVMLTTVNYERIDITPNGTTIEVPANKTEYAGSVEGAKLWNWDNGILVTYNENEDPNFFKVTELGFNALLKIVKTGEKQDINGLTCYVINADELFKIELFDVIKVNYNGKFYCIPLSNETSHDNIIICCNNKDMAVHMAESVVYKKVYPDNTDLENALSTVENLTGSLPSIDNSTNLSKIKSSVENETGVNLDGVKNTVEQYIGKLPI